jgi:hypothetical protein
MATKKKKTEEVVETPVVKKKAVKKEEPVKTWYEKLQEKAESKNK